MAENSNPSGVDQPFSVDRLERLIRDIEREHGIVVLYVSECSSRAWGYDTTDSDHDLRFSYFPLPWQRDLEDASNTLRVKVGDIDLQGFEVRKTMQMLVGSNLTAFEMMESKLKYLADTRVENIYRQVMQHYYAPQSLFDALGGLVKRNWLKSRDQVDAKELVRLFRFCLMVRSLARGDYLHTHLNDLKADAEGSTLLPWVMPLRSMDTAAFAAFRDAPEYRAFERYIDDTLALRYETRPTRQQVCEHMAFANARYRELMEFLHTDIPQLTPVKSASVRNQGEECAP